MAEAHALFSLLLTCVAGIAIAVPLVAMGWAFFTLTPGPAPAEPLLIRARRGSRLLVARWPSMTVDQKAHLVAAAYVYGINALGVAYIGVAICSCLLANLGGMSAAEAQLSAPLGSWLEHLMAQLALLSAYVAWLQFTRPAARRG